MNFKSLDNLKTKCDPQSKRSMACEYNAIVKTCKETKLKKQERTDQGKLAKQRRWANNNIKEQKKQKESKCSNLCACIFTYEWKCKHET